MSPFDLVLPSSVIQSQYPTKSRVVSKLFFKKNDDGALCQDFVGNSNLDVVESQLACLNQMSEGINSLKTMPSKMAKVREVLSSLDINVYSRQKNRFSTGI